MKKIITLTYSFRNSLGERAHYLLNGFNACAFYAYADINEIGYDFCKAHEDNDTAGGEEKEDKRKSSGPSVIQQWVESVLNYMISCFHKIATTFYPLTSSNSPLFFIINSFLDL